MVDSARRGHPLRNPAAAFHKKPQALRPASADFRRCLKQERDRERSRRESAQGKFEAAMLSLDMHAEPFDDPGKIAVFSDGGAEAELAMRHHVGIEAVKMRCRGHLKKNLIFLQSPVNAGGWGPYRVPVQAHGNLRNAKNPRLRHEGRTRCRRGSGAMSAPSFNEQVTVT